MPGLQHRSTALRPVACPPGHRHRPGGGVSDGHAVRRPPRRPRVRLPVPGRRGPRCRAVDGRAHRLAVLLRPGLVERVQQQEASGQERQAGTRQCTTTSSGATSPPTARTGCGWPTSPNTAPDEGKLYLCAIKDAWSRRIVGDSIDSTMKSRLTVNALNNAVARRGHVPGCVIHTDRGSQFRSRKFVSALNRHHLVGSMGRVGAARRQRRRESFFGLLQNNVLDHRAWPTRQHLRTAIVTWIERTYHRRRRSRSRLTLSNTRPS